MGKGFGYGGLNDPLYIFSSVCFLSSIHTSVAWQQRPFALSILAPAFRLWHLLLSGGG